MDRAGLRRKLLKAQAEAGDIVLLFGDESEALTHPYLAHAWAKKGADLRIPAPGQAAKVAMLGLLDWAPRELIVRTSRSKRSADFIALLEQIDTQYGLTSGRATKPIVLVLDNGPIHTSKATRAALAERAPWLTVEWLPKYAPELNDIEELWRDLKQHHLVHQTFAGPANLDDAIHEAVAMLNYERSRHPLANHRIAVSRAEAFDIRDHREDNFGHSVPGGGLHVSGPAKWHSRDLGDPGGIVISGKATFLRRRGPRRLKVGSTCPLKCPRGECPWTDRPLFQELGDIAQQGLREAMGGRDRGTCLGDIEILVPAEVPRS